MSALCALTHTLHDADESGIVCTGIDETNDKLVGFAINSLAEGLNDVTHDRSRTHGGAEAV